MGSVDDGHKVDGGMTPPLSMPPNRWSEPLDANDDDAHDDDAPGAATLLPVDHFVPVAVPSLALGRTETTDASSSSSGGVPCARQATLAFMPPDGYAEALRNKVQRGADTGHRTRCNPSSPRPPLTHTHALYSSMCILPARRRRRALSLLEVTCNPLYSVSVCCCQ